MTGSGRLDQHTFRLGKYEQQAKARNHRLEQLWAVVEERWRRDTSKGKSAVPLWDADTLAIGSAVAQGLDRATLRLPPGSDPVAFVAYYADFNHVIPVTVDNQDALSAGADQWRQQYDRQAEFVRGQTAALEQDRRFTNAILSKVGAAPVLSGATIHAALDRYAEHVKAKYQGKDRPVQLSVRLLREHAEDFDLSALDGDKIETWLRYWSARPASKDATKPAGTPLAATTCRNTLTHLRAFLRWLARSSVFSAALPTGYANHVVSFPRQRIVCNLPSDRAKNRTRRHWTRAELATLYRYAKPYDRALMIVALNVGAAKSELANLIPEEIVRRKSHTYVVSERHKTGAYGEWLLWDETLDALKFLAKFRKPDSEYVIVSPTGRPLNKKTPTGNENQTIKNRWDHLLARIQKDQPDFHALPFKHLRKTGANLLRHLKVEDATELAVMYLAHGEKNDGGDTMLSAYADRPWKKLHRALLKLRKKLLPVFRSVPDPWEYKRLTVSLGTQEKCKALRAEGKTYEAIGAELGIHWQTASRICTGKKKKSSK